MYYFWRLSENTYSKNKLKRNDCKAIEPIKPNTMDKIRAMITGIQGYVPEYRLTNKELESLVETNDEWITSRTGIKERRILKGENQGTSDG